MSFPITWFDMPAKTRWSADAFMNDEEDDWEFVSGSDGDLFSFDEPLVTEVVDTAKSATRMNVAATVASDARADKKDKDTEHNVVQKPSTNAKSMYCPHCGCKSNDKDSKGRFNRASRTGVLGSEYDASVSFAATVSVWDGKSESINTTLVKEGGKNPFEDEDDENNDEETTSETDETSEYDEVTLESEESYRCDSGQQGFDSFRWDDHGSTGASLKGSEEDVEEEVEVDEEEVDEEEVDEEEVDEEEVDEEEVDEEEVVEEEVVEEEVVEEEVDEEEVVEEEVDEGEVDESEMRLLQLL